MITIENLVKDYGAVRAVNRINFTVQEGEILGFLGPNGAGKSTTLKLITCYLSPTEGNIKIDNLNIYDNTEEIRNLIGYLPENNPLYTDMIVYDYLRYIGQLRGLNDRDFNRNLRKVIDKCGLKGYVAKPIHTLSKGYRQRVGLAQAIIHDPKILILDEPTSGLDPNQIVEIRDLIKDLGKEKTLILSSHILQEVQAVCSRIIIINKGDIVADGSMEELKASFQGKARLLMELLAPDFDPLAFRSAIPTAEIASMENEDGKLQLIIEYPTSQEIRPQIFEYVKQQDWVILEMHREYMSLEDLFRTLTTEQKVLTA